MNKHEGKATKRHLFSRRAKTPTVYQMEATECGAASLGMILGYYGQFIPLEQLRVETGVSRDGCNARNILRAARKFGLSCKGYTRDIDGLLKLPTPCILHWNFNHFVVFEGVRGKYYYINDPASGRRKLTREEVDDAFTGVVLCFEKEQTFQKRKRKSTLPTFFRQRLKGQKLSILGLFILGLILVVPGLVVPIFSQVFVDDILIGGNVSWLGALLAAMVGTTLFQGFFTWLKGTLLQKLQAKMSLVSAHKFLYRMFRLPISFFDQRYAGDLSQRVANNNKVSTFLSGELADTILSVFIAAFYLVLLLLYSPLLTVVGVLGVGINMLLSVLATKKLSTVSMKAQQDQGKMVGALYSGLAITSTLKASGAENEYVARVLGYYTKNVDTEQRLGKTQELLSAVPSVISVAISIVVMMIGGSLVIEGQFTTGMLVAFSQTLSAFTAPINQFVGFFQRIETLKADMSRVEDIEKYAVSPQFQERKMSDRKEKLSGEIDLRGVSFGYSPLAPPIISDFHFHAYPGRTVALVGASGCGKSTVSKLISGLYDPWEGEVLFDGIPLREVPPEILSVSIATVSQSITLFSGSIRDNLTLWNRSVKEEEMIRAAKDACIHEAITKLPGAYDYRLEEAGSNLSGGQRQRLEIARALIHNPSILLMDEATSALDPIVEKEVIDNIKRRGCTCVIVAHRLSTIRDCDEILVMQKGLVVERGTHEELKHMGGLYEALIRNE